MSGPRFAVVRVAVAAAAFLVPAATACGGSESVDGAAVFRDRCASCHGPRGEGGTGPALRGQAKVEIVTAGRPTRGMPAFGEILSDDEIEAVVDHANSLG